MKLISPLRPAVLTRRRRRLHVPRHADPPAGLSGLIVETVSLRNFRSYERLELALRPGLVLAVGPNGVGKTNLLEALHVGTQGFSPRTRTDVAARSASAQPARARSSSGPPRRGRARARGHAASRRGEAGEAERRAASCGRAAARETWRRSSSRPTASRSSRAPPAVRRAYFDRALGRLRSGPRRAAGRVRRGGRAAQRRAPPRRRRRLRHARRSRRGRSRSRARRRPRRRAP